MTEKAIAPNKEFMLAHVEHLFGDCIEDGLIELAWTGPRNEDREVCYAQHFDVSDYHDLVDRAYEINSFHGSNVYIGAGLRKASTQKGMRTKDSHVEMLPALYIDLDKPGMAEAAREKVKHIQPTMIVTTGRIPHVREQFWWKLDEPIRDFTKSTEQIRAITEALGGDSSISNPSRVMRLAGSVAYPKKEGRVTEATSLERPHDYPFAWEAFETAFPPSRTPERLSSAPSPETPSTSSTLNLPDPLGMRVVDCLRDVHMHGQWHKNVLRLTAHWVRSGLSDTEILLFSTALTQAGYDPTQTERELQVMIRGARQKWDIPDPTTIIPDAPEQTPLVPNFLESLNLSMIPARQWVLGRTLLKGHLSVLVAPPGVGKSTLVIAQAVSIITGRTLTGQDVHRQGKVWLYNNEDDTDELKRRLGAVLQHNDIPFNEIKGQLAMNSGADRPLLLAKTMSDGTVIRLPDVEACIAHIKKNNIGVFIVDPFIETHECDENSNQEIKRVGQMFRDIARQANCAVLLVHHTAKPPQGSSEGHAGNMNTARGASALIGVARVIETLFGMSKKDAERYGIQENLRHFYVRLDDAKANLSLASPDARWYRRVGVVIANTDEVGVLEYVTLEDSMVRAVAEQEDMHHTVIAALLAQVDGDEITLNKAVMQLAWGGHSAFEKFRITDDQNRRRAKTALRNTVIGACKANIVIVTGVDACGFSLHETPPPAKLRRFVRPAVASDLASQPPENFDSMEDPYGF